MIYQILKNEGFKINHVRTGIFKDTSRWSNKYICECEDRKIYAVIAQTTTQKFYLKRSVDWALKAPEIYKGKFRILQPFAYGEYNDSFYALYNCRDYNYKHRSIIPVKKLESLYLKESETVVVSERVIERIKENFLQSFPEVYRERIIELEDFKKYFHELSKLETVDIWFEHGDFTFNNLSSESEDEFELMDYEFFREYQPCGFDRFDYYSSIGETDATDSLNVLKQKLINEINEIIDKEELPQISIQKDHVDYDSMVRPNFIHNRLDIKYGLKNVINFHVIECDRKKFVIQGYISGDIMELAVWLTPIQQRTFNYLISYIFNHFPKVSFLNVMYSKNDYKGLSADNHWVNILPNNEDDYLKTLGKKTRYNRKYYYNKLDNDFRLEIKRFHDKIDNSIIRKYFEFKLSTYGTNYHLTPDEYVRKYAITDADVLYLNGEIAGINLLSIIGDKAYLENLTYDLQYRSYSVGTVLYYISIVNLINDGIRELYLADGEYEYKSRFGAIEEIAFNGLIQKDGFSLQSVPGAMKRNIKRVIKRVVRPISEIEIIERIIIKICGGGYRLVELKPIKPTARCPVSFVLEKADKEKYLLVIAMTDTQRFYLHRSIAMQKVFFRNFEHVFDINFPVEISFEYDFDYAIYKYYSGYALCKDLVPCESLKNVSDHQALDAKVDGYLIEEIVENLLLIWPVQYRKRISRLIAFRKWIASLSRKPRVKLFLEHGDFNNENVLFNNRYMLIDFEFGAFYQPVGFDVYSYMRSVGHRQNDDLSEMKLRLMDDANDVLDKEYNYRLKNMLIYYALFFFIKKHSVYKLFEIKKGR